MTDHETPTITVHLPPRVYRLLIATTIAVCLVLIGVGIVLAEVLNISNNTNTVVKSVKNQTSPESIENQQAAIDGILSRIDCNQRIALQSVIETLINQGILQPGSVNIISSDCVRRGREE